MKRYYPAGSIFRALLMSMTLIISYYSNSQETLQVSIQLPLSTIDKVNEVYGNEFISNNPTIVASLLDLINSRIEFQQMEQVVDEKYATISSLPLMNKYNSDIQEFLATVFTPESFNPLCYGFNFFDSKTQIFRIDNTSYLLIIHPVTL